MKSALATILAFSAAMSSMDMGGNRSSEIDINLPFHKIASERKPNKKRVKPNTFKKKKVVKSPNRWSNK